MSQYLSLFDLCALGYCLLIWFSYAHYSNFQESNYNLVKVMHRYRLQWIKNMIKRSDRTIDIKVIGNLQFTTTYLIIVSVVAIGGIFVLMAYGSKAVILLNELPFISTVNYHAWLIKSFVLLAIFIFGFFKLTWAVRQLNYAAILVLAAPYQSEGEDSIDDLKRQTKYVSKTATVLSNAGRHFNTGMRSFYFGMASLSWFVSPIFYILAATLVVAVLYRREYMSKTLILLS